MHTSDEIWSEVRKAVALLTRMKIPYVLGGSLAGSTQGAPRTTNDADLMIAPFPGREAEFARGFGPEYYVSVPSMIEANRMRSSFNVINTNVGFKLDFFVQKQRPFDASALARREAKYVPDGAAEPTDVLSPEDLVLTKLEWYRLGSEVSERQWKDVIEILEANWPRLDRDYLSRWAKELKVEDLLPVALEEAGKSAG
jgi:hypothetical protein